MARRKSTSGATCVTCHLQQEAQYPLQVPFVQPCQWKDAHVLRRTSPSRAGSCAPSFRGSVATVHLACGGWNLHGEFNRSAPCTTRSSDSSVLSLEALLLWAASFELALRATSLKLLKPHQSAVAASVCSWTSMLCNAALSKTCVAQGFVHSPALPCFFPLRNTLQ